MIAGGVLVTGAAGGIGAAVARRVAAPERVVALVDRDAERLGRLEAELTSLGCRARALPADVADPEAMAAAFDEVAAHGPLAGVVSAAGILEPGGLEVDADSWQRHLAVNAGGVLHCLQGAAQHVADGGAVVVIGSNAARVPRTRMIAYAASKAAAAAATRAAGLELAPRGIRCNVVEPGSTDTAMQRDLWSDPEEGRRTAVAGDPASYRLGIPLGRIAQPDDVAAVAAFLLSSDARHVTLQQIYVDGGASL